MIDPTNQEFRDSFRKFLEMKGLGEKTIENHISQATNFLFFYKGNFDNEEELREKILEYYTSKRSYLCKYSLKYLFEFLEKRGIYVLDMYERLIKENKHLFKQKPRRRKKKWISKEEFKKLLDAVDDEIRLFLLVQYETAARAGALIKLQKFDVTKEEDGTVSITLKEKGGVNTTYRISKELSEKLLKKIEKQTILSNVWNFSFGTLFNHLREVSTKVLGYPISSHFIRASRAVHLLEDGHNIITVMRVLRHKNLQTTYRYLMESGVDLNKLISKDVIGWLYEDNR